MATLTKDQKKLLYTAIDMQAMENEGESRRYFKMAEDLRESNMPEQAQVFENLANDYQQKSRALDEINGILRRE